MNDMHIGTVNAYNSAVGPDSAVYNYGDELAEIRDLTRELLALVRRHSGELPDDTRDDVRQDTEAALDEIRGQRRLSVIRDLIGKVALGAKEVTAIATAATDIEHAVTGLMR